MIPIKDEAFLDSLRSIVIGMTTFLLIYGIYHLVRNPKLFVVPLVFVSAMILCWTMGEVIRGLFEKEKVTRDNYYGKKF